MQATSNPDFPATTQTPLLASTTKKLSAGWPSLPSTARQTVPKAQRQRQGGGRPEAAARHPLLLPSPCQHLLRNNASAGMPMPAAGLQKPPFQYGIQQGMRRPAGAAPNRPFFILGQLLSSRRGASGKANVAPCRSPRFYTRKDRTKLDLLVCLYRGCLKAPQSETPPINPSACLPGV